MNKTGIIVFVCFLVLFTSCISASGTFYKGSSRINEADLIENKSRFEMLSYNGDTLYVGGSGPDNYSRIQDAINAANEGDTIFVYDDSSPYVENLYVDKRLNIVGENPATTIIDGSFGLMCATLVADGIQFSGFTCMKHLGVGIGTNSNNNVITKNIIRGWVFHRDIGILLEGASNNTVSNNWIYAIYNSGIELDLGSNNNTVVNNTVFKCRLSGIWLNEGSSNNKISYNTFDDNGNGIFITEDCRNNEISFNHMIDNWRSGIKLLRSCNDNTINQNLIMNNERDGINLTNIDFYPSIQNKIYLNTLKENILSAFDDQEPNIWYNTSLQRGNYWDDYLDFYPPLDEEPPFGVWDIPYNISGGNNQDRYPLVNSPLCDYINVTYVEAIDQEIEFFGSAYGGIPPYSWKWDFSDGHYSEEQNPTHSFDEPGLYHVELEVTDSESNTSIHTIQLRILIDNEKPKIYIEKPYHSLYILNQLAYPFWINTPFTGLVILLNFSVVIGSLDIEVDVKDNITTIDRVEVYINDKLEYESTESTFSYNWKRGKILKARESITIVAYDAAGNRASKTHTVWRFL